MPSESLKELLQVPDYCKVKADKKYKNTPAIKNLDQAAELVQNQQHSNRELLSVIYLDNQNKVLDVVTEAVGGRRSVLLPPENVFRGALMRNAESIIVSHNHPGGDPTPSSADIQECARLMEAGKMIKIPVRGCLVIGKNKYRSIVPG